MDYNKNINEQKLLKESRVILSLIYRDYICSKEKRTELLQEDKKALQIIENELREKYNPDKIFKKKTNVNYVNEAQQGKALLTTEKVSFIRRILNSIKRLFKK